MATDNPDRLAQFCLYTAVLELLHVTHKNGGDYPREIAVSPLLPDSVDVVGPVRGVLFVREETWKRAVEKVPLVAVATAETTFLGLPVRFQ